MTDDTLTKDIAKAEEPKKEPEYDEDNELGGSMTFLEHLAELRERLIKALVAFAVCTVVCFMFSDPILKVMMKPLPEKKRAIAEETIQKWNEDHPGEEYQYVEDPETQKLIAIHPFEGIMAYVKISVIAGIFIAFPIIFYQAWMFIAPGLYKKEKRVVLPMVFSAWFCFILGGCFCYFIIYSFILQFLELFTPAAVETQWTLSNYIAITTRFMLAFGIIFEEPVVITLLAKIGIVTAAGLGKFRPYAIVIMFSLSALITPPDPFSQMACALPLYLLYELSILIVRMIERGKEESGESYAG
ncbi:MAG: twin-arginine translocase subunit TatC [Candidatus Omnitrophica bacterium]|nr:twin-arginine translocase subunit TatC [Candidatus Omnitrophota bacterium]